MVVLLISFFLRPKEPLHPVCQRQTVNRVAAVNPSEALHLPPHSRKISVFDLLAEQRFFVDNTFKLDVSTRYLQKTLSDFKLRGMIKML